jgi:hypothetical protein
MNAAQRVLAQVILVVLFPVGLAAFLYFHHYTGQTTQAGVLIHPPFHLTALKHPRAPWQILSVSLKGCGSTCVLELKQIKQLLNVHQTEPHRLATTLWVTPQHRSSWNKAAHQLKLRATLRVTPAQSMRSFLSKLSHGARPKTFAIIDPKGYIPLYYPQKDWPIALNKDLSKLMKQSQIG